ncbi:uncharacterized protein LOC141915434 isoform X2 [Tubulanus polymorphus]|uniref:uncharacterized protein LOC141915434 isoform X2 n=1 Tax=Tubulanus polymorphus TaxID=672921 RepID=UPI003DA3AB1A
MPKRSSAKSRGGGAKGRVTRTSMREAGSSKQPAATTSEKQVKAESTKQGSRGRKAAQVPTATNVQEAPKRNAPTSERPEPSPKRGRRRVVTTEEPASVTSPAVITTETRTNEGVRASSRGRKAKVVLEKITVDTHVEAEVEKDVKSPRGRGRTSRNKRNDTALEKVEAEDEKDEPQEETVKEVKSLRGRGRPTKNKGKQAASPVAKSPAKKLEKPIEETSEPNVTPRGRSRKGKSETDENVIESKAVSPRTRRTRNNEQSEVTESTEDENMETTETVASPRRRGRQAATVSPKKNTPSPTKRSPRGKKSAHIEEIDKAAETGDKTDDASEDKKEEPMDTETDSVAPVLNKETPYVQVTAHTDAPVLEPVKMSPVQSADPEKPLTVNDSSDKEPECPIVSPSRKRKRDELGPDEDASPRKRMKSESEQEEAAQEMQVSPEQKSVEPSAPASDAIKPCTDVPKLETPLVAAIAVSAQIEPIPQQMDVVPPQQEPVEPEASSTVEQDSSVAAQSDFNHQQQQPMEAAEAVPEMCSAVPAPQLSHSVEPDVATIPSTNIPKGSVSSSQPGRSSTEESNIEDSYVIIEMSDVPPADSDSISMASSKQHREQERITGTPPAINSHSKIVDNINGISDMDALLNRSFVANPNVKVCDINDQDQFSIVSYNILADCHLRRGDYSHTPAETLDRSYRHKRLMAELKHHDADIICLQEVDPDYFNDTLKSAFESMGYKAAFRKRVTTPENNYFNEGEATFVRSNRFTVVSETSFSLRELAAKLIEENGISEDQKEAVQKYLDNMAVVLITKVKCNTNGKEITIGNIHVTYDNLKFPDEQCIEIACAMKEIVNIAGGAHNPHMIVGDFNSVPTSAAYQLLRDGYLSSEMIEQLQKLEGITLANGEKKSLVNLMWKGFQHMSPNMASAYFVCEGSEPEITHAHKRFSGCLDYIFYGSGLETLRVSKLPLVPLLIPTTYYPSDHILLKARMMFVKKNQ